MVLTNMFAPVLNLVLILFFPNKNFYTYFTIDII